MPVTYRVDGRTPLDDPINRSLLADLRVKIGVFRTICWQGAWDSRNGEDVSRIASISRVLSGELVQELWRGFGRIIGDAALVTPLRRADDAPMDGFIGVNALMSTGRTFGHGTKEIQRQHRGATGAGVAAVGESEERNLMEYM